MVILPSSSSSSSSGSSSGQFPAPQQALINAYSVEAKDEAALTEYLESSSCRRAVLAKHLDGHIEATSYITTNSILCDQCKASLEQRRQNKTKAGRGRGSRIKNRAEAVH